MSKRPREEGSAAYTPREVSFGLQVRHLKQQVRHFKQQVRGLEAQLEDQKAQLEDQKAQLEDQKAQVHGLKTDKDADMEISDQLDAHEERDSDEYDSDRTLTDDSDATQPFSPKHGGAESESDDDEFDI
jgi:chromosome segregation ATPase